MKDMKCNRRGECGESAANGPGVLDDGQLAKFRVPMDGVEEEAAGDEEDGEEVEDEETEPQ